MINWLPTYSWKAIKQGLLVTGALVVMVSCGGGFETSQHPDQSFRDGGGIGSLDAFGGFIGNQGVDARFRRARVTTQSDPLRLKTRPEASAASPASGPDRLPRNSDVLVYWPLDIVNNHVKVFVDGRTLWVTYRSSGGREYVTLLEDIAVPPSSPPSSGTLSINVGTGGITGRTSWGITGADGSGTGLDSFAPLSLRRIRLSSSDVSLAYTAIGNVNLTAARVQACDFNPAVGNHWNGDDNCYNQIIISSAFSNFVQQHGHSCAVSAARSALGLNADRILFHSAGAGQVRPDRTVGSGPTLSTHATGQAFDLYAISVFSGANRRKVILHRDQVDGSSTTERQNHDFYWAFTRCWRQRVQSEAPCACADSKVGALTYLDNSAHRDHLHMSLPMCNRERFNVSCI